MGLSNMTVRTLYLTVCSRHQHFRCSCSPSIHASENGGMQGIPLRTLPSCPWYFSGNFGVLSTWGGCNGGYVNVFLQFI